MCNSYTISKRSHRGRQPEVEALVERASPELIRPTLPGPVMLENGAAELMRWGFKRPFANAVNNTRSDKLDSAMWREAFEHRRCLIPVSGYYEYTGPAGGKQAHRFTALDDDWLWVAGIWEENPELGRCYSMVMTAANAFVSTIHHRMPALLAADAMEPWLAGEILSLAPSTVDLAVAKAANPLKRKPPDAQGELF